MKWGEKLKHYFNGFKKRHKNSFLYTKKRKYIKETKLEDSIDIEEFSKNYEKELAEITKELDRIKKEYYSKNIQLESIQKQTSYEIIKSIMQRYLNIKKNN